MSKEFNIKLYKACESRNLQIIRKIIESSGLRCKVDLTDENFLFFRKALKTYDEDIIDYVFKLDKFISSDDIKKIVNGVFAELCWNGKMEDIVFVHRKEKLRKHLDINYNSGVFFRTAYSNGRKDVLSFLINELGLKITNENVKKTFNTTHLKRIIGLEGMHEWTVAAFLKKQFSDSLSEKLKNSDESSVIVKNKI